MLEAQAAPPVPSTRRFRAQDYVELTMHFQCNLKCEHCMIEGTMDWLKPESMEQFESILAQNAQQGRWKGLVMTGSEVTLRRDLPELARAARSSFARPSQLSRSYRRCFFSALTALLRNTRRGWNASGCASS